MDDCLAWTENELQLLETTTDFKAKKAYEGVNLDYAKDKYLQILSTFVPNLSQEGRREYLMGEIFRKDQIAAKIKQLPYKYRKALDLGTQGGAGGPNRRFFLRYLQRNMEKIVRH